MAKELHMMIGGTGTGKSTLSKKMNKELGYRIFSPDEIEHENSQLESDAIDDLINDDLNKQISSGESFILDGKCLTIEERTDFISKATENGYSVHGHNFGAGTEESKQRRLNNPLEMPSIHWKQVCDSDLRNYEAPNISEGFTEITNY